MKHVLIFGGTRFFGKKLVGLLVEKGFHVTIATRGVTPDPFGDKISRIALDRENPESIRSALGDREWDIVYDNICFSPNEARDACEIFAGRVKHYVFTSSLAVYYQYGGDRKREKDFDPYSYPVRWGTNASFPYDEGKRLAEAVFFQQASFPVCAVRFPIVLGTDDYTRRLHFHVEHVRQGIPIGVPNQDAMISFISSDEAAAFLAWLADQEGMQGPVNACSSGELPLRSILALIEGAVGKPAIIKPTTDNANMSPFGVPASWWMDTEKATAAGFSFQHITDWYPALIHELASQELP